MCIKNKFKFKNGSSIIKRTMRKFSIFIHLDFKLEKISLVTKQSKHFDGFALHGEVGCFNYIFSLFCLICQVD